jgi:hypothetical protein
MGVHSCKYAEEASSGMATARKAKRRKNKTHTHLWMRYMPLVALKSSVPLACATPEGSREKEEEKATVREYKYVHAPYSNQPDTTCIHNNKHTNPHITHRQL